MSSLPPVQGAQRQWRIQDVLQWTRERFEREGLPAARLDAEVLLAHALSCDRISLYTSFDKPLRPEELGRYREAVSRRLEREPVSYITGTREFWSVSLTVDPRVLVPRPSTETLVEQALQVLAPGDSPARALDLGTGSGAIAIALARERPALEVVATDISGDALELARVNVAAAELDERIALRAGDLFQAINGEAPWDLIVSNPPYIPSAVVDGLEPDVRRFEPRLALDGGADGLDVVRRIISGAGSRLRPGGALVLEIGHDQGRAVTELAQAAASLDPASTRIVPDYEGHDRVLVVQRESD